MTRLVVLRPEPAASATAERARAAGWAVVVAPLFVVGPVIWSPPPGPHDATMMTSANAARHGGSGLAALRDRPLYAVGAATAAAARAAGFATVVTGDGDAETLVAQAARDGVRRLLHLAGREHRAVEHPDIMIDRVIVYAADTLTALPAEARAAIAAGAIVLLHSPRAAAVFAARLGHRAARLAAISPAAAAAAGEGWSALAVAGRPTDDALLAAAARLCDKAP